MRSGCRLFDMQVCEDIQCMLYIVPLFNQIRHHAKGSPECIPKHIKGRCRASAHNGIIAKGAELFVVLLYHSVHFLGFLRSSQQAFVDRDGLR